MSECPHRATWHRLRKCSRHFTVGVSTINPVEKSVSLVKVGQKYRAP